MGNFPSDTSVDQYNGNKVEMGKGGAQRRKDDILSYPSLEAIGKNGEYSNSLNIFNLKSLTNTVPLNSRSSTGISLL